ncbi:sugar transferase [Sphingomonas sp. KR3-1]|uniref:sugar transferase n=1 Tax=Sphingomonas sp. KR3-1 TaxID=3156611 RepID=UPI0032B60E2D
MPSHSFTKRVLDVALCLAAAPIAVPLCMLLLIAIRLESSGAPLLIQRRVGREGRVFPMWKLRTMFADTADLPSHQVGAARITRLGRILRKLKFDELPQLANVLVGQMSLIGPRPCLPSQQELIEARRIRGVLQYLPGITGPAQLMGVDMSEPVRLAEIEAEYCARASLRSDLQLLIRTALGAGSGDAALKRP